MASTVTVGCKIPNGLHLDAIDSKGERIRVTLRGSGLAVGSFDMNVTAGAGLTHNVDADFWNAWVKEHADFPAVKSGLIFAYATPTKAADAAADREDLRTGLEGMDPDKPAPGLTVADATI